MSAACFQDYPFERIVIAAVDALEMSYRRLTVITHTAQDYAFSFTGDGSIDSPLLIGYTLNSGEVNFMAAALEQVCGMGIFCNYAKTGRILVETVYGAEGKSGKHC